jgi:hypothetical protein
MKSDETPDQALAAMVEDVFAFGKKLTGERFAGRSFQRGQK